MRVFSDLHLEFEDWRPLPPKGLYDILILAGDIAPLGSKRLPGFLEWCADRHEHVIYVAGNHEFYGAKYPQAWDELKVPRNVYKLEKQRIVIDGQGYCGATLWTDLTNPLDERTALFGMYDYTAINNGRFHPRDTTKVHLETVEWMKGAVQPGDVVITHHLPTYASVAKQYEGDALNPAFATEHFELIDALEPAVWIHGHTHTPCDYMLGATRIICNPKGYYDENFYFTKDGYV